LIVSKTMQVYNNVKSHLQILRRRLPSASTSMSLMVSRIVAIIGALHGIVIARFIATRLPYCVGALTTVRRIYTRHRSCLSALPINPIVDSRIYITISRNTPGDARRIMETTILDACTWGRGFRWCSFGSLPKTSVRHQ